MPLQTLYFHVKGGQGLFRRSAIGDVKQPQHQRGMIQSGALLGGTEIFDINIPISVGAVRIDFQQHQFRAQAGRRIVGGDFLHHAPQLFRRRFGGQGVFQLVLINVIVRHGQSAPARHWSGQEQRGIAR